MLVRNMNDKINTLKKWILESNHIVFFGGAGVSTESGLKDFRSKDGLYFEKYDYPPEEILSHHFFMENTEDFYKFYKDKLNTAGFKPNITHLVLAKLEKMVHQEAGSKNVLELHGSIKRNYCMKCKRFFDEDYVFSSKGVPKCPCGGIIKPDVVLYEEGLDEEVMQKTIQEIRKADLFIIAGTSLAVYPAASFIRYYNGKRMVLINRDETPYDAMCDLVIHDSLGKIFKEIEKEIQ